ncbi:acyltransferase family-domain-containing protein [Dactylonectria macrodidyma]|uniref:Acyltransferase family-domain-containing protein n=1 Tax=Dactylonectria macrodidyma TaxID=307937 RepID=A0A9P9IUX5_9HYPO|nr:acyltransferase family-domain-containing protein [Dactylonectria macrodidyma]
MNLGSSRKSSVEETVSFVDRACPVNTNSEPENRPLSINQYLLRRCDESLQLAAENLRSISLRFIIGRIVSFLVPSFLQGRHVRDQIHPPQLGPTAYLDGMRGLACLMVFNCHTTQYNYDTNIGWGSKGAHYDILRLPFVRILYAGTAAVCIFFVISGYALSYKVLKLVRSRKTKDFSATMSSLIFRRGLRLFLPTTFSTFIIACLLRIGVFEWFREHGLNKTYFRKYEPPVRLETTSMQLYDWTKAVSSGFQVYSWHDPTKYDRHLWTISIEYRNSLYLFLMLYGTAHLHTPYRITTLIMIMYTAYRKSHWSFLLFLCGMALVEWDHHRGAHTANPKSPRSIRRVLEATLWNVISFLGLYLLGQPSVASQSTPGWEYLTSLVPEWWSGGHIPYWQIIGSMIFVFACGHSSLWQRFFTSRVAQYFGKISYSLYIVHGTVTFVICLRFNMFARTVTGVEGYWGFFGFFLSYCFATPLTIWCADIFCRAVDIPTVKFAKWFEGKLMSKA